ncbi:hypothetical protein [Streptomyces aidingensis]|uniref:Lipoprotein n=1 Tax=Streptomyces aidingensis TaxID=910347 RepID=A0A1I1TAR0_9ACTN|nr:hypothetical protein [Streptomyces aidingensis]SFD55676.1 hypothetical protein SAMN05421773_11919 [Streptomyces aidingensis]
MRVSHRRAAANCLIAFALGAVVLTGCSDGGTEAAPEPADRAASETSETSEAPEAPEASEETAPEEGEAPADEESPAGGDGGSGGTEPDDSAGSGDEAPWAGTKQFVQIEEARIIDGQTYLSVRPAQKEAVTEPHEYWVVVPGEGPYTMVPMVEDAQVLLSVPIGDDKQASPYSQAEFVTRLAAQSPSDRSLVGYDLSFDGEGRVTRVQSLFAAP